MQKNFFSDYIPIELSKWSIENALVWLKLMLFLVRFQRFWRGWIQLPHSNIIQDLKIYHWLIFLFFHLDFSMSTFPCWNLSFTFLSLEYRELHTEYILFCWLFSVCTEHCKQMHPHFHYRCVLGCLGLQLTFKAEKVSATLIASYIPNNFLDNYWHAYIQQDTFQIHVCTTEEEVL